jgi:hypothetical protein
MSQPAVEPETAAHRVTIELREPLDPEVAAGAEVTLRFDVSCVSGCDMRGSHVDVIAPDGTVVTRELIEYADSVNRSPDIVVRAPAQVGEFAWTIRVPTHESRTAVHEECSRVVPFKSEPHMTSLAVWDVRSPIVTTSRFDAKVGVKCSASCALAGHIVEVRDAGGAVAGTGMLSDSPWPGTSGLYWAELPLAAPEIEGVHSWSAVFRTADLTLPHKEALAAFSFRAVGRPDHRVTIHVVDKDAAPLEDVEVRLGVYRAKTDERGIACVDVPKGSYDLDAWKTGYHVPSRAVEVLSDISVHVESTVVPEKDPDDELWM